MNKHIYPNPELILRSANVILLVDWPDLDLPFALLKAGFVVYSYSPGQYSEAILGDEKKPVIFRDCESAPRSVDIVNVYRSDSEISGIFEKQVLPFKAKAVGLQPPLTSFLAKNLAEANDLDYLEGVAIAEVAGKI